MVEVIRTDVLVVGSGPAGSTAARFAAQGGVDVIMIDKKSEIGSPKRCAEGVSKEGLSHVGVELDPRWITKEITGVRMVSPDGTDVWLTEEEIELPEAGYILERKVFDKHMAMGAARAGAQIMIKTLAKGLRREADGTFTVICEKMGETFEINAKILIGADGPEGHIGKWAGLKSRVKPNRMESGIQYEMCNVTFEREGVIEFYVGSCAPGGYVWIFPKGDDIANVGLAILAPHADKVNPGKTAKEYLDDWIATSPITKDAQAVELNVGGDPVGGMPKKIYADNIMVCGDAAGQVNPLTGGGIISGMTGGMYAGQVAAEAIKEGDCSAKFLKKYDKLVRDDIGDEIKKYAVVQDYMLGLKDEDLDKIAHEFVDVDFSKVSTTQLVKALIKVSPSAALKLGKYFL